MNGNPLMGKHLILDQSIHCSNLLGRRHSYLVFCWFHLLGTSSNNLECIHTHLCQLAVPRQRFPHMLPIFPTHAFIFYKDNLHHLWYLHQYRSSTSTSYQAEGCSCTLHFSQYRALPLTPTASKRWT